MRPRDLGFLTALCAMPWGRGGFGYPAYSPNTDPYKKNSSSGKTCKKVGTRKTKKPSSSSKGSHHNAAFLKRQKRRTERKRRVSKTPWVHPDTPTLLVEPTLSYELIRLRDFLELLPELKDSDGHSHLATSQGMYTKVSYWPSNLRGMIIPKWVTHIAWRWNCDE